MAGLLELRLSGNLPHISVASGQNLTKILPLEMLCQMAIVGKYILKA